jgi:hypothetical protein
MKLLAVTLGALAIAGCTTNAAQLAESKARDTRELADALKGRTPGKPVDCVRSEGLNGPQIIGTTLLYDDLGKIWRTDLDACPGLRNDSILVVQQYGSQMCERDRFTVVERGSSVPGATCWMGKFTPYTKAKL